MVKYTEDWTFWLIMTTVPSSSIYKLDGKKINFKLQNNDFTSIL